MNSRYQPRMRNLFRLLVFAALCSAGCPCAAQASDLDGLYAEVTLPEFTGDPILFVFDASSDPGKYSNQEAYSVINFRKPRQLATGQDVVVAILDTGVNPNHPALVGHLLPGYNALNPGQPPLDIPDGTTNLAVGHGTMIAGIIAKIAPGAMILPIRVLNADGAGTISTVLSGLVWAVQHGAQVVNMSFSTLTQSSLLDNAVDAARAAGAVLVAAVGNASNNTTVYPAACSGVIGVASVDNDRRKSEFSNFGSSVRLVAPGSAVRSTYWDGGYANWSGTSFATAFVTAEAVLVASLNSGAGSDSVVLRMLYTARSVDRYNPLYVGQLGNGLIDISAAAGKDD